MHDLRMNLQKMVLGALLLFVSESQQQTKGPSEIASAAKVQTDYKVKRALIIGINKYSKSPGYNLQCAEADANGMDQVLRLGYGFTDVTLLLNEQATKTNILSAVKALSERAEADDLITFYISSHGETRFLPNRERVGFFLPSDVAFGADHPTLTQLQSQGIRMDDIYSILASCEARHSWIVADACFSGLVGGTQKGNLDFPKLDDSIISSYLQKKSLRVFSACDAGDVAKEDFNMGHGIFTGYLLEVLREVSEDKRPFEASELFAAVRRRVMEKSKGVQVPGLGTGGTSAEVVLKPITVLERVSAEPVKDVFSSYPDVPDLHWANDALSILKNQGIWPGYPDGLFRGTRPATRYESLEVAFRTWRYLSQLESSLPRIAKPAVSLVNPDVPENHWTYEANLELRKVGVILEYPDGQFHGQRPISRKELAGFLVKIFEWYLDKPISIKSYQGTDIEGDPEAQKLFSILEYNGIAKGFADGSFKPMAPATRYQVAAFIGNVFTLSKNKLEENPVAKVN